MKLQVQYGSDLYELLLTSKDNQICVERLLDEIERRTKVPKCHQTLLYKGQRLDQTPKATLDELHMFNNSKLILCCTPKQTPGEHRYLDRDQKRRMGSAVASVLPQPPTRYKSEDQSTRRKEDGDGDSARKIPSSAVLANKQQTPSCPIGFTPEPNKTYEYYTVPYRTDPTTLVRNMSPFISNIQQS